MKLGFIELETAIKIELSSILEQLNQRHSQRERVLDFDDDEYFNDTAEEKELSTQFLQMQKNQILDLQEHFERYSNTLSVFGFNSAKYDINLIKSYLLPIFLTNDKLNLKLSKKLISLFPSSLVMCSYLILWTFLVGLLVLTRSSKLTEQSKLKIFRLWQVRQSQKVEQKESPPFFL